MEFMSHPPWAVYSNPREDALYHAVVDGRDKAAIEAHIAASWKECEGDAWWETWMTSGS